MKSYIVDASVVAKWLLQEPESERAQLLIKTDYYLRAPDLIMTEFASILLKRIVRKEMTPQECRVLLGRFLNEYLDVRVRVIPSRLLAVNALEIARKEARSIYDGLYLALAVQARCQLITADEKLVKGIRDKEIKEHVIALNDPALALEVRGSRLSHLR